MSSLVPYDDNLHPIPALGLKPGGAHRIDAGSTSMRNVVPFDLQTQVIGIFATGPIYIRTGNAEVTAAATDHHFPEKHYCDIAVGGNRKSRHAHLAVIAVFGS